MLEQTSAPEMSEAEKYSRILAELKKLGAYSLQVFKEKSFTVQSKDNGDDVTEVDEQNDLAIREAISKHFPEDGIITEEGDKKAGTSGYDWVVDPLDGTKNFKSGNFNWHITATRTFAGKPVFTIILTPTLNTDWSEFVYQNEKATESGHPIPKLPEKKYESLRNVQIQIRTPYERDVGPEVLLQSLDITRELTLACGRQPINSRDEVSAALTIAHGGPQEVLIILPGATAKLHDVLHGFGFIEAVGGTVSTLKGNPITEHTFQTEGLVIARSKELGNLVLTQMSDTISKYIEAYQSTLRFTPLARTTV